MILFSLTTRLTITQSDTMEKIIKVSVFFFIVELFTLSSFCSTKLTEDDTGQTSVTKAALAVDGGFHIHRLNLVGHQVSK